MLFLNAIFLPEPLISMRTSKEILSILTTVQKTMWKGFSKAYVEKARLAIPVAIDQVESKYFKHIYGQLLHCATKTEENRLLTMIFYLSIILT